MTFRCGDHVHHGPTGEDWVVAYVDGNDLAWCGWPDGLARTSDCTLIKAASDEEHLRMLKQVAESKTGRRAGYAQRELAKLSEHAFRVCTYRHHGLISHHG